MKRYTEYFPSKSKQNPTSAAFIKTSRNPFSALLCIVDVCFTGKHITHGDMFVMRVLMMRIEQAVFAHFQMASSFLCSLSVLSLPEHLLTIRETPLQTSPVESKLG